MTKALFYLPQGPVTGHTVSAERYARLGEMHIEWFDEMHRKARPRR